MPVIKDQATGRAAGTFDGEPPLRRRFTRAEIGARAAEIGSAITAAHRGRQLVLVCITPGGVLFLADLVRSIRLPVVVDFLAVRPLDPGNPTGHPVALVKDLEVDINDRDVLLVDDLVDSGRTVGYLARTLLTRDPRSVRVVALLDRPAARRVTVDLAYAAFEIGPETVAGCGIAYAGWFRGCPDVWEITDPRTVASDPLAALAWAARDVRATGEGRA